MKIIRISTYQHINNRIRISILGITTASLSGCIALALAPLAPLVGGMGEQKNSVIIDAATVSPELKAALWKAKRIAVVSNDPSVSYFAEELERKGGYEITAED